MVEFAVLPPHTRGWTASSVPPTAVAIASPAHAGMDPAKTLAEQFIEGFPRTRGDGPSVSAGNAGLRSLPPHTRGWTPGRSAGPRQPCASPAHAGMDPAGCGRSRVPSGFPRTRGDGPPRF